MVDRGRIILFAVLALSVAMLIAGAVMLGVGIHKANSNSDSSSCPGGATVGPTIPPQGYSKVSVLYASSRHPNLTWTDPLANSSSPQFAAAASDVSAQITKVLGAASFSHVFLASPAPVNVIVHRFAKDLSGGVDSFTSLVYPDQVDAATLKKINDALNKAQQGAAVWASPLDQCNGQPIAPPNSQPVEPTRGPTTLPTTAVTPTLPGGAFCDASSNAGAVIFLVDLAVPAFGNYEAKLANIRSFLLQADLLINLPTNGQWSGMEFYLVPYYGFDAYTLNSSPCRSHACWQSTVTSLNSSINYNKIDAHNLAHGLNYIVESLGQQLPKGVGRTVTIVTDGLDQRFSVNVTLAAQTLRTNDLYTISAISAAQSTQANSVIGSLVTDPSHFYSLPDLSWLSNKAISASSSYWMCNALYPTPPPTTTVKTPLPLDISTTPQVTSGTTPQPTTTPPANCPMDIIYLIDESQTMLDSYFTTAQNFVSQVSHQINGLQPAARFALVSFNDKIVFSSNGYLSLQDLDANLLNISRTTGNANYAVGFTEARKLVKLGRNSSSVLPLIVFITDGDQINGSVEDVIPITTDLRKNFRTEIIALGMNPLPFMEQLIKRAVGVGAMDTFTAPHYVRINSTDNLIKTGPAAVINNIECGGSHNNPAACYTDLTFVIESSYAMFNYEQTEIETVKSLIVQFTNDIGPFYGRVSVIYFSSPDKTGTLFQMNDNAADALNSLKNANIPAGGASDIKGAMQLASQVIDANRIGNDQMVIFMTRGIFVDGNSTNCCDDPAGAAAELRKRATVQGVLLGQPTDKAKLDLLTGSNSTDANALIPDTSDPVANGAAIAAKLKPIIQTHMFNAQCSGIPDYVPPCMEDIDVTIAFHSSDTKTFATIQSFIAQSLLPAFFGGSLPTTSLTRNSPINLAIMTVDTTVTHVLADFTQHFSPATYADIVSGANITTSTTPYLSKVYNATGVLKSQGRPYASNIVIVITDAVSVFDQTSALNALNALSPAFAEGIQIGNASTKIVLTGAPIVLSVADQLSPVYPRSSRAFANQLAMGACKVVTTPAPVTNPPTTQKTTPAPLPRPKPRDVWPDITILVDTSYNGTSAMTDRGFQQIRQFIYRNFLDGLYVADLASRVALATFDANTTVACTYGDISNYYDLRDCIVNSFEYNVVLPHTPKRDLSSAIENLKNTVFNTVNGYRPLKENFLLIFTTGSAATDATQALQSIQRMGIRTVGFDLGGHMDPAELSLYGADSMSKPNWMDENSGINGDNLFGPRLVDRLTMNHAQPLANFYADFFFVIDESYAMNGLFPYVRTFLHNFVGQLTFGVNKARVAVVPYSFDVISSGVLELTDNSATFEKWWNNQFQYTAPNNADANLGAAVTKVGAMVGKAALTSQKPSYIIYIAQSTTCVGANKALALNNIDGVTQFVLPTNPQIAYANQIDPTGAHTFKAQSPKDLNNWLWRLKPQNQIAGFFNSLTYTQEEYRQRHQVTIAEVQADIAFAVDLTGLTNDTFTSVKQYLIDLTSQFHVSQTGTRFALQAFNGRMVVEGGFHFMDSKDDTTVKTLINNLRYEKSNFAATQSDLVTALIEINEVFMTAKKGWRNGPTYVIMLPSGEHFYNTTAAVIEAKQILSRVQTFAIGLNGNKYGFVKQFVADDDHYKSVNDPSGLVKGSPVDQALTQDIQQWNENLMFPSPPALSDVNADFVFLLDYYHTLGTDGFAAVQLYLQDFIWNSVAFTPGKSRMAVVSYAYSGVMPERSFSLTACKSQGECSDAVNGLTYMARYVYSDLLSAVNYFFHNSTFGYDPNRLTIVVDIANAPTIGAPISNRLSYQLNQETFTFAYTYGNATEWSYLGQFLGEDGQQNFNPSYGFSRVDNMFKKYVIAAYQAWQGTFGN